MNDYPDLNDENDSRWHNMSINTEEITKFTELFTGRTFYEWLIEMYSKEVVIDQNIKEMIDTNSYFLNFNYTTTLENYFRINKNNVYHIHRSVYGLHTSPNSLHKKETLNNDDIRSCIQFDIQEKHQKK